MADFVVDVVEDDSSFATRQSRGGVQPFPWDQYAGQTIGFLADEGDGLIVKDGEPIGVKGRLFTADGNSVHGRYTSKRFAKGIANSTSGRAKIGVLDTYGKGWVLKPGADKSAVTRLTAAINTAVTAPAAA